MYVMYSIFFLIQPLDAIDRDSEAQLLVGGHIYVYFLSVFFI